jgi:hypothetical protein
MPLPGILLWLEALLLTQLFGKGALAAGMSRQTCLSKPGINAKYQSSQISWAVDAAHVSCDPELRSIFDEALIELSRKGVGPRSAKFYAADCKV